MKLMMGRRRKGVGGVLVWVGLVMLWSSLQAASARATREVRATSSASATKAAFLRSLAQPEPKPPRPPSSTTPSSSSTSSYVAHISAVDDEDEVRPILAEFYYATNGPSWRKRCGRDVAGDPSCWLSNATYCAWWGISCSFTKGTGVTSFSLNLGDNDLDGHLPESMTRLATLEDLSLPDNKIRSIPPFGILDMPNLSDINLADNLITSIPPQLGNLTNLSQINMKGNPLQMDIPEWLFDMPFLLIIHLAGCGLTGTLPHTIQSPMLSLLDLTGNKLTGPLPTTWQIPWPIGALVIKLSFNQFHGSIPSSIFALPQLSALQLDNNHLSGPLKLLNSVTLNILDLSNNDLSGTLDHVPINVRLLDISNNPLMTGSLPNLAYNVQLIYLSVDGNVLMRSETGDALPSWLGVDYTTVLQPPASDFLCYPFRSSAGVFHIVVPPSYFNYSYCYCMPSYFGLPPDRCMPCLEGGNCSRGHSAISWPRGYYPIFDSSNTIVALDACARNGLGESACNPNGNCSAQIGSGLLPLCELCSPGTSGRLCSQCLCPYSAAFNGSTAPQECYFDSNGRCLRCSETETIAIATTLGSCLVAALLVWILLALKWPRVYRSLLGMVNMISNSGTFKIALVWLQISVTLNTSWPEWVLDETGAIKWFRLSNLSTTGIGLECIASWLSDPRWNLLAYLMLPPAITVLLLAMVCLRLTSGAVITRLKALWSAVKHVCGIGKHDDPMTERTALTMGSVNEESSTRENSSALVLDKFNAEEASRSDLRVNAWEWGRYVWLWSLYFLFFGLAHRTFDVFSCVEEPVTRELFLASLPWLPCSTRSEWGTLMWMGVGGLVAYVIGIPLLIGVLMYRYRGQAHEPHVRYWMGHLYQAYRDELHWFEMVIITRRLLIAAIAAMLPFNSGLALARASSASAVLIGSLMVQRWVKPFKMPMENTLEEVSLVTILMTFILQEVWAAQEWPASLHRHDAADHGGLSLVANTLGLTSSWFSVGLVACALVWHGALMLVMVGIMVWPIMKALRRAVLRFVNR